MVLEFGYLYRIRYDSATFIKHFFATVGNVKYLIIFAASFYSGCFIH